MFLSVSLFIWPTSMKCTSQWAATAFALGLWDPPTVTIHVKPQRDVNHVATIHISDPHKCFDHYKWLQEAMRHVQDTKGFAAAPHLQLTYPRTDCFETMGTAEDTTMFTEAKVHIAAPLAANTSMADVRRGFALLMHGASYYVQPELDVAKPTVVITDA
jgi:hypothetical protein